MVKATFGAGCFWGVEETFRNIKGVTNTAVGYLGGDLESPTYEDICTGRSGHAEVLQMDFDPDVTNYDALLDVFWQIHDPTTLNRQGPDVGAQYRSAIFFHDEEQRQAALASKEKLDQAGVWDRPVITEISPATIFFRAEEYHQQYFAKRGLASCHTPPPMRDAN